MPADKKAFNRWLDKIGKIMAAKDEDWDRPSPAFRAEYEEYMKDFDLGKTPEQVVKELDNDIDAAPGEGGSARTVDDLSEAEVRALLKKVQEDVIAGNRQESSSDVGDFVTNTLAEAGLQTEPTTDELAAEDAEWDKD